MTEDFWRGWFCGVLIGIGLLFLIRILIALATGEIASQPPCYSELATCQDNLNDCKDVLAAQGFEMPQ